MTGRLRNCVAALAGLLGLAAPGQVLAQETQPAQDVAQPARNDVVGPPQLQNFTLNGTVTREAPAPQPSRQLPPSPPPSSTNRRVQQTGNPQSTTVERAVRATVQPRTLPPPTGQPSAQISSAPTSDTSTATEPAVPDMTSSLPQPEVPPVESSGKSFPILPWIAAALALAGAAAWFVFFRRRGRESYAGVSELLVGTPGPATAAAPQPATAPKPQASPAGVVSTRLRPWIEIHFNPQRAVVDDNKAAIAFELIVSNTGTVPARDVLLEASLFNAGPVQDQQIQLFFDNPVAKGDRIPVIGPNQRITVNTAVFLARDKVRPITIEGRQLFVPLVGFNALYSWGGSNSGQTSKSYLVGRKTEGEKLAPFRLDMGARVFRTLEAREHEIRLRK